MSLRGLKPSSCISLCAGYLVMILFRRSKKKSRRGIKYELLAAASSARTGSLKIDNLIRRLRYRRGKLFEMLVEYTRKGFKEIAASYSNEIAQLDKMINELTKIQIALERVAIRAETIAMTGVAVGQVASLKGVIKELKKSLGAVIPDVSMVLSDLEGHIESAMAELEYHGGEGIPVVAPAGSAEVEKILREAEEIARIKIEESMPKRG